MMAHFARVENQKVVTVIVVSDSDCGGGTFPDSEPIGQEFISSLGLDGLWLQTSYNANFRGNYAGIGFTYDETLDAFIPPKPSDDATLDESTFSWVVPEPDPEV